MCNSAESPANSDLEMGPPYEERTKQEVMEATPEPSAFHQKFLNIVERENQRKSGGQIYTLFQQCVAELFGTMFIVLFGVGSVCSAVLFRKDSDLWHVTTVWGFGVALAILVAVPISGAHLNPAVSLAMAIFRPRDFPLKKLLPFWLAQYLGGVLGGAFNLMIFARAYDAFEEAEGITRGDAKSVLTASTFGEVFPAPNNTLGNDFIGVGFALLVEAWATGILTLIIFSLTDSRQKFIRNPEMVPFYIGFTVAVLMTLYTPMTQGGFNPARDFGPRLVAAMAGWGKIAIPGPKDGFWIYIVGPKLGAVVGALVYTFFLRPGLAD